MTSGVHPRGNHPQYPYREPEPWRSPATPPGGPAGDAMAPWLEERLFDRRIVLLRGQLTGPVAGQTAAALFTLDAMGPEPVQVHVNAPDGELAAAFAVVDAIDAMNAEVHAVVTAEAGGAAIAVLAAARRRSAYRHARIRLAEPRAAAVAGTADQVASAAGQYLRELEEFAVRLAEVTGRPRSRVEDDLSAGRVLTAEEAREYGLIDEIVGRRDGGASG
jgi:ATP-dependent Clp protease protease subunit